MSDTQAKAALSSHQNIWSIDQKLPSDARVKHAHKIKAVHPKQTAQEAYDERWDV